jgi:hypothetical protein
MRNANRIAQFAVWALVRCAQEYLNRGQRQDGYASQPMLEFVWTNLMLLGVFRADVSIFQAVSVNTQLLVRPKPRD